MIEAGDYVRAVRVDIDRDDQLRLTDPTGTYVVLVDTVQWSLGADWALARGSVVSDLINGYGPTIWIEVPLGEFPSAVLSALLRTAKSRG